VLFGKKIVVTGVASGIGKRTAELAAQLGADVIGIDVKKPDVPVGRFMEGDIGTAAGVAAIASALPGGIDALCNVAGISGKAGIMPTVAINFYGLRELSLALAAKIREGGSVVNVASIAGYGWRANLARAKKLVAVKGFPDVEALLRAEGLHNEFGYPLSKELLLLWTMQAAHEPVFKARGIRVNAVSPGPVETPILTQFREVLGNPRVDSDIDRVGRPGTAEDIAPPILFLCSDAARWISGANLPVDGGLEASINAEVLEF
jgi:NAD(P)-dependent dehydrogenase (short-subunit alcohol dehydrogenase family)